MCGIVGILSSNHEILSAIGEMTSRLAHRGPDKQNIIVDESKGVALGHRRLSILDLSDAGGQPMTSSCGRFVIVFNGEIYNFERLRKLLDGVCSVPWVSNSDTEVLLELVSHFGVDKALGLIEGMYAFAIWDREKDIVIICRDRIGEKPLYYGKSDDVFFFGSELKVLKSLSSFQRVISRDSLAMYLRYGAVPAPFTIYNDVFKLEPGSRLTISLNDKSFVVDRYWDVADVYAKGKENPFEGGVDVAKVELDRLLNKAVVSQMQADVPLGAFLSGGIDSSTIVAIMQKNYSMGKVKTFSVGFESTEYSEAEHARAVSSHIGTDHNEIIVTESDALNIIPKIPHIYDEPFADSSQIPTFLVSQLAKQSVSVALSGDGGDELFGGYNRYTITDKFFSRINKYPISLRSSIAAILKSVPPAMWDISLGQLLKSKYSHIGDKIHKGASVLNSKGIEDFYHRITARISEPYSWLASPENKSSVAPSVDIQSGLFAPIEKMMIKDIQTYLPNDILTKVDRASMAVSLEARVPFLDKDIIEFSASLPLSFKLRDNRGKWILREVLNEYVPQKLIDRPKMGFTMPLGDWLRGPLREWAEELLDPCRLEREGFFNAEVVAAAWERHKSRRNNNEYQLWNILMFQVWLQENEQ